MMIKEFKNSIEAQAGVDYILGLTIFLGGIITVFYVMTNIISPISGETNELDYVAISISEYLISNFSTEGLNVVNLTKMNDFLSMNYTTLKSKLGAERYNFNITIKDLNNNIYARYGPNIPTTDTGYVKRLIVDSENPQRLFLEVVVWR